MRSQFIFTELEKVWQKPTRTDLTDKPLQDKLASALLKQKNGKCDDSSGILPEMVKASCRSDIFVNKLIHTVWDEGQIP